MFTVSSYIWKIQDWTVQFKNSVSWSIYRPK